MEMLKKLNLKAFPIGTAFGFFRRFAKKMSYKKQKSLLLKYFQTKPPYMNFAIKVHVFYMPNILF